MKMVNQLNEAQKIKLASASGGKNLMDLVSCATQKNIALLSDTNTNVDPRQDNDINTAYNTLWGINANTNNNERNLINASVVYNTLKGNAITCSLAVGGCDYHARNRNQTDTKDLEIGQLIGRVLQSAAIMNKKLFLHIITDGSVSSNDSSIIGADFTSDNGEKGAFYTILFDPETTSSQQLVQTKKQMGHYSQACAVDTTTLIGNSAELASLAVVYNYLLFSYNNTAKANAEFNRILPNTFSKREKEKILMYTPLT